MSTASSLVSREILESEMARLAGRPGPAVVDSSVTEMDKKLIASYRNFVRFNVIKQKKSQVLEDYVFNALGKHLCESPTISYESFKIVSQSQAKAKKYFSPKNFLLFPKDANQCIESEDFVKFIERSLEIENTLLALMEYAHSGLAGDPYTTTISEQQLNSFLFRLIQEIDVARKLHDSFFEFYVYTAAQKFTFFLDSRKTNSMPIKRLAHSAPMEELLQLRRLARNYRSHVSLGNSPEDEESNAQLTAEFESMAASNWFSGNNAVKIYSLFLELDRDQNGFLAQDEVRQFAGLGADQMQLTGTALQRLFDEYVTFQPFEMDYRAFVNLVLACESITSPEALRYFWRLLDTDRSGYLSPDKIKLFYKDIHDSLAATGYDAPNVNHVVLEVFDLVSCNDPRGPTLKELVDSKQGHTVVTMLIDMNGFWRYDNRESLMAHPAEEEEPTTPPPPPAPAALAPPSASSERAKSSLMSRLNEDYDDDDFENFDDLLN